MSARGGIYEGPGGEKLHGDGKPVGRPITVTSVQPDNRVSGVPQLLSNVPTSQIIYMQDPLDCCYKVTAADTEPFGEHYCGPMETYPRNLPLLAAKYPGTPGGQTVEVWVEATPARFYAIKALAQVGESEKAFTLSTGSDQAKLAADIAGAIAVGMLSLG